MNIRLHHAAQVVGEAVEVLVSSGSTRDRLLLASKVLLGVTPREFESFPGLNSQWIEIDARLSVEENPRFGSYDRSVRKMSAPRMRELCYLILKLERTIRATD